MGNEKKRIAALQALASKRAYHGIKYAARAFRMVPDEVKLLLRNTEDNTLTKEDIEKRDRLVAAVDNIIAFSVAEEYQLYKEADMVDGVEFDDIDWNNPEEMAEYYDLSETYNKRYAAVENSDIEYAMTVAWSWIHWGANQLVTYWTQNDDRVRPWHYALQGYSARRDEFPEWMIPPIEWGCRCFLIIGDDEYYNKLDVKQIVGKAPEKPKQLDGIFSESVAKCGMIFGEKHPYFNIKASDKDMLQEMVDNIKKEWYGNT